MRRGFESLHKRVSADGGEETAIRIANEAVRVLYEWDKLKKKAGKSWLFPSLLRSTR